MIAAVLQLAGPVVGCRRSARAVFGCTAVLGALAAGEGARVRLLLAQEGGAEEA